MRFADCKVRKWWRQIDKDQPMLRVLCCALLAHGCYALRASKPVRRTAAHIDRRTISFAAPAALLASVAPSTATEDPEWVYLDQRQGLGKFTKLLNNGAVAQDAAMVTDALKAFDLPSDEKAVAAAMAADSNGNGLGGAAGHKPVIVSTTLGAASAKITAKVEGACMDPSHCIRLMWLCNADTDEVICAKEFTKFGVRDGKRFGGEAIMKQATVPKGIRVEACAFCNVHGIWVSDAVAV